MKNTRFGVLDSGIESANFGGTFGGLLFSGSFRPTSPIRRTKPKIGRNQSCDCGSGKKAKKCCWPG